MHPNAVFASNPRRLLTQAAAIGFAHIVVAVPVSVVMHAPVTLHGDRPRFHVARANRAAAHPAGADLLVSVVGPHGYVSPGWYADPADQVPT